MKNADMPAMPLVVPADVVCSPQSGLTKREMMAMHALQGLLAAPDLNTVEPDAVAGTAIACVDALLAELDRTSK